jgi:Tfp pilus assembly protein PilW
MRIRSKTAAFTLVEMLMSLGCGSLILAAVITSSVSMQRSYAAIDLYSTSETNQLRVLDYVALDIRRALSVCVTSSALTLTLPVYYSSTSNTAVPNTPNSTTGNMTACDGSSISPYMYYGSSSGVVTVVYQKSGTSFTRTVTAPSGGSTITTTKAIATNVAAFAVTSSDNTTGSVKCSIMFFPTFTRNTGYGTWYSGTTLDNTKGTDGDWFVIIPATDGSNATSVGNAYYKTGGTFSLIDNVKATQVYINAYLRNPVTDQS